LTGTFAENQQCVSCHAVKGTPAQGVVGPNLTHFAGRERFAGSMFERTDENLEAWLRDPPARKPGSKMPDLDLTDEQITALVAYLQSLK
jgi:cytochrome c oxidase subunit 2